MARGSPEEKLISLCNDFFVLGLQISAGNVELPNAEALLRRIMLLFETLRNQAHDIGIRSNEVDMAGYALAAYLDEMIQYSDWPGKQQWAQRPLQAVLYNETQAGTGFFERIEVVRRQSKDLLSVYYACLVLGFMGAYRQPGGPEQLDLLIGDLRREAFKSPKALSIHGNRPSEAGPGRRRLPLMPIAAVSLTVTIVAIIVMYFILSSTLSEAVDLLSQMGRG